jgi:sugar lactone lactonase YvrE
VNNGTITTFAGNGSAGFSGDGGPATAAALDQPNALAFDISGALLLCDSANHRLRRIANGILSTAAGNGIQGFAGDGTAATSAELDTPSAVAVSADGRIFIADAHNNRIRVIATNGIISTLTERIPLPLGLAVTSTGAVLFTDANGQRLRSMDVSGNISTLAGSGVQGSAPDASIAASAELDTPGGVAVSSFGYPAFADTANRTLRVLAANGNLYLPAALASGRSSNVALTLPAGAIYGQAAASVAVSGSVATPQGIVQIFDVNTAVAQASLNNSAATVSLATLSAGAHTLSAVYRGDGLNPFATSSSASLTVTPAALIATADPQTAVYGTAVPPLTGSLTGLLPQDTGSVSAVFTTTAQTLSPVGVYPIVASLSGPASPNYGLSLSPASGSLHIVPASTTTVAQQLAQNSYAGLPLRLDAAVASTTSGVPTGSVNFTEGSSVVASASLSNGAASAVYLSPAAGTHSLIASYSGDANFTPSLSAAIVAVVSAMPDFTLVPAGSATQTVQPGAIATYTLAISAQPAPFTGAVSMSVSGLPPGATATFAPPQVVPGSSTATTVLSVQTVAPVVQMRSIPGRFVLGALALPLLLLRRRRSGLGSVALGLLSLTLGCGSRSVPEQTQASQTYTLTVSGTSTNLAGAVIFHTTTLTLNIP